MCVCYYKHMNLINSEVEMERSEQISLNNFDWTDVMLIQMNDNTFKEVIVLDV